MSEATPDRTLPAAAATPPGEDTTSTLPERPDTRQQPQPEQQQRGQQETALENKKRVQPKTAAFTEESFVCRNPLESHQEFCLCARQARPDQDPAADANSQSADPAWDVCNVGDM